MSTTTGSLPILDTNAALQALRDLRAKQPVKYSAFYSSQLGGIVTDPALMVIPFDDHMVHRGHGIFDTAGLVGGNIYDLEAHLDRPRRPSCQLPSGHARRDAASSSNGSQRRRDSLSLLALIRRAVRRATARRGGFFVMIFRPCLPRCI
jgi:hypothetical protein